MTAASVAVVMAIRDVDVFPLVGEDGFRRLVAAFYRRVAQDDILGDMYPRGDYAGAEDRLRLFLTQRFGGPSTYSEQRGHPRLRMRHVPFAIDQRARDRWVALMDAALDEAELPGEVVPLLRMFFSDSATFLINRPG